jgi:hypothetical protein
MKGRLPIIAVLAFAASWRRNNKAGKEPPPTCTGFAGSSDGAGNQAFRLTRSLKTP